MGMNIIPVRTSDVSSRHRSVMVAVVVPHVLTPLCHSCGCFTSIDRWVIIVFTSPLLLPDTAVSVMTKAFVHNYRSGRQVDVELLL